MQEMVLARKQLTEIGVVLAHHGDGKQQTADAANAATGQKRPNPIDMGQKSHVSRRPLSKAMSRFSARSAVDILRECPPAWSRFNVWLFPNTKREVYEAES